MKYKIYLSAFVLLLFSKLNAQVPNAKTIKYFSKTLNYHPLKADFLFVSETETVMLNFLYQF